MYKLRDSNDYYISSSVESKKHRDEYEDITHQVNSYIRPSILKEMKEKSDIVS